jgi:hypothetical protein
VVLAATLSLGVLTLSRLRNMATKTYGTVSAEQQKSMSGLEFVKGLASGVLPLNTFAKTYRSLRR